LSTVVAELLCKNIDESKLESILDRKLFFRLRFIVEELVRECEELRAIDMKVNGGCGNYEDLVVNKEGRVKVLEDYLEAEKERLLA
jgi:hypothetical protein